MCPVRSVTHVSGWSGFLYSIQEQEAVGKIVAGKRGAQGWLLEKTL